MSLRDDVTSHGNAHRYGLNLVIFEDWMCCCCMMQVASKEGAHFDDPTWSETAHLAARGAKWLVPPEWTNKTPNVGIVKLSYCVERDESLQPEFRNTMAVKYL